MSTYAVDEPQRAHEAAGPITAAFPNLHRTVSLNEAVRGLSLMSAYAEHAHGKGLEALKAPLLSLPTSHARADTVFFASDEAVRSDCYIMYVRDEPAWRKVLALLFDLNLNAATAASLTTFVACVVWRAVHPSPGLPRGELAVTLILLPAVVFVAVFRFSHRLGASRSVWIGKCSQLYSPAFAHRTTRHSTPVPWHRITRVCAHAVAVPTPDRDPRRHALHPPEPG